MGIRYKPDDSGFREIGSSKELGSACVDAARGVASIANGDDPAGRYEVHPATVPAGWKNELRAGARVVQTQDSRRGVERRTLTRAANGS